MTDRLDEIRARREAATPGGELFARLTQECDDCYTPQAQLLRACTYHEGWLDGHGERDPDIDYLLAEVERLRAALASVGYRLTRKDDGSDHVYWVGKDSITEGDES
jgi:hypothetical protein